MLRRNFLQVLLHTAISLPFAEGETAETLYANACHDLKSGKRFERIADWLRRAESLKSDDFRIPVALACACTGRFASLAYAASWTHARDEERRQYPTEIAKWEKAQKDPDAEGYGEPRPEPPPDRVFLFKDDNQPCVLTSLESRQQMMKTLDGWKTQANAALKRATDRARTDTEKAEVAFYRGWCLRILETYTPNPPIDQDPPPGPIADDSGNREQSENSEDEEVTPQPDPPKPEHEEMIRVFTEATRLSPNNALYYQALGFVTGGEEAIPYYRKALEIAPKNAPLWYLLFVREYQKDKTNRSRWQQDLDQARRYDPNNAWYTYRAACLLMQTTDFERFNNEVVNPGRNAPPIEGEKKSPMRLDSGAQETAEKVITLLQQGNAGHLATPHCAPPVPRLLAVAFHYNFESTDFFPEYGEFRALARGLGGYAIHRVQAGDYPTAKRAVRTLIEFGTKLCANLPLKERYRADPIILQSLVGAAIAGIGYATLEQVATTANNLEDMTTARVNRQAFREQVIAWKDALKKVIVNNTPYDYY